MIDYQRNMLETCKRQFQNYASDHRAKAARYEKAIRGCSDEVENARTKRLLQATIQKAEVNEAMVKDIELTLQRENVNVLADTARFADIVYEGSPSPKDVQTQLGVHFEEIVEMLDTLEAPSAKGVEVSVNIGAAKIGLEKLANSLKGTEPVIHIKDRVEFIDSIADQLVTATVGARMLGMYPVQALREVNRSNMSKLTDGKMARDPATNKWVKGPNYTKPELARFA